MEKVNQFVYETFVDKKIKIKVDEQREENGEKVTVSKEKETIKPIKLAILKPTRKRLKESDIYYAKRIAFYLKEGLLPYSLLNKRYLNDGGPLSEETKTALKTLRDKLLELQTEYFGMTAPLTEENNKRRGEIIIEINQINKTLAEFENSYASLFENTAEVKTKNDTIDWWLTILTYIDNDDNKGYVPFFEEGDTETRLNKLEELQSLEDEFINSFIRKASYFVSFMLQAGNSLKPEDYKSAEEHFNLEILKLTTVDNTEDKGAE